MRERRLVDEYNRIKFDSRCYNWPGLRRATVSLSEPLRSRSERELNKTIGGSPQICSDTHREEVYKVKKKKKVIRSDTYRITKVGLSVFHVHNCSINSTTRNFPNRHRNSEKEYICTLNISCISFDEFLSLALHS